MADIKQSIQKWCTLQERSSFEVIQKLVSWNIQKERIPLIMNELKNENFLNDERFAEDYARGKFRIKHWGKTKIRLSLQQKKVNIDHIDRALEKIDETEYMDSLRRLAEKKNAQFPEKLNIFDRKVKLYQFLISKGFEGGLVREVIKEIIQ